MTTQLVGLGKRAPAAVQEVLDTAGELAAKLGDDAAHSGHLLFALMQVPSKTQTQRVLGFPEFNITERDVFTQLLKGRAHPDKAILEGNVEPAPMAPSVQLVLRSAIHIQEYQEAEELNLEHLLLGMLATRVHMAVLVLERVFGLDMRQVVRAAVAVVHGYQGTSLEGLEAWAATSGTSEAVISLEEVIRGRWMVDD